MQHYGPLHRPNRGKIAKWAGIALISFFSFASAAAQSRNASGNCQQLNDWLADNKDQNDPLKGEKIIRQDLLRQFYKNRACTPAWGSPQTELENAEALIEWLRQESGDPGKFHLDRIEERLSEIVAIYLPVGLFDYEELTPFDVWLTDAALQYMYETASPNGQLGEAGEAELLALLETAVENHSITETLSKLGREGLSAEEQPDDAGEETKDEEKVAEIQASGDDTPAETDDAEYTVNNKQLHDLAAQSGPTEVLGLALHHPNDTKRFYQFRNFEPAWSNGYTLLGIADQLIKTIRACEEEGLVPADYHFPKLDELYREINESYDVKFMDDPQFLLKMDLLLTDAALQYAHHLRNGRLNPKKLDLDWNISREKVDLAKPLAEAVANEDVTAYFAAQAPPQPEYAQLKKALKHYRTLAKSGKAWKRVPEGEALHHQDTGDRVTALRNRLSIDNPLPETANELKTDTISLPEGHTPAFADSLRKRNWTLLGDSLAVKSDSIFNPARFDSSLYKAVVAFQRQHGIETDGVVGSGTLAVLNTPPEYRTKQITINMERWRWLPNKLGEHYLQVNIPAYWIHVVEDGKVVLDKNVMVGKPHHETPVFDNLMQYLELNPYWTVPYSIATNEILPHLKRDPGYLKRNNMKVFSGGKSVNPNDINWGGVSRSNFRYTIRQEPGPKNALGTVKFMFPNEYNIYLHDTPSKSLFANAERAYSHGCIRLENPLELAEYLLADDPKWDADKIQKALDKGKNKQIPLQKPIPIYLLYNTVWTDEAGTTRFQNDVYGRDRAVMEAYFE